MCFVLLLVATAVTAKTKIKERSCFFEELLQGMYVESTLSRRKSVISVDLSQETPTLSGA